MKTIMHPRLFLNLLWFPLVVTVAIFMTRQAQPGKSTHLTAPKDILQFTSGGHVLGFAKTGVYVASGSHALRVEFLNSHSISPMSAAAPSAPDNTDNAKKVRPLSEVTYPNLWDGVTLTYDAPSGAIARSTYRLEPYANTENIRLRYNAPVAVQGDGSLRVNFKTGTLNESAPQAWQERSGKRVPVQIAFAPRGKDEITFTTGYYDRSQPLFIDPTLTWNTFLGGSGDDIGQGVAVDASGNVYVTGYSNAAWGTPVRAYSGGQDAFAAKLDSNGNLTWNTFLGGSGNDFGQAVALDGSGNVYVTGNSLATWGTPVRAFIGGNGDAFAAKLDSNGNLIWNTFLGGGGQDANNGLAVDGNGNVYMSGYCELPWGSPIRAYSGGYDAFAAKLDSNGNLIWNTFLGGGGDDYGDGLALDASGNVYICGNGSATWGSPVRSFSGGYRDGFVAKLDSGGNLIWNTFLGGAGTDVAISPAADQSGNVYISGYSDATWGSPIRAYSGGYDAFAAKLDSGGNLIWNTFLGGSGDDLGQGLALDASGNVYISGYSSATWGSPDRAYSGGDDVFAAQLDSSGNLIWNTFLGGAGTDVGASNGLAVDGSSNIYVAGSSNAAWGSPVRAYTGGYDAFVAKLSAPTPTPTPTPTPFPGGGNFVIGDRNAVVGNHVTFWGAQWANLNSLSGGPAPASFKGFAESTTPNPPLCGGAWTSDPGNSSGPPSSLPPFITVIAASSITQFGSVISGNIPEMVIVQTDPGYGPDPGHPGTGTVVAVFCLIP